jgi:8-oxo-dGTP diphosphatase
VIAGVRRSSHGAGSLALPGGHLEFGEGWAACAAREVMEETGLAVPLGDLRMLHVTNDVMEGENKHYVTIFMGATVPAGAAAANLEPGKCEGWGRYTLGELRGRLGEGGDPEGGGLFGPLGRLVAEGPAALETFMTP